MVWNLLLDGVQSDIILHNMSHHPVLLILTIKSDHGFRTRLPHLHNKHTQSLAKTNTHAKGRKWVKDLLANQQTSVKSNNSN